METGDAASRVSRVSVCGLMYKTCLVLLMCCVLNGHAKDCYGPANEALGVESLPPCPPPPLLIHYHLHSPGGR